MCALLRLAPDVLRRVGMPKRSASVTAACAAFAGALAGVTACDALGSFVVEAGDFAGAKADVHCDRRFVSDGGQPAAFCQEVLSTVAAAEFADDCRAKHRATAAPGACPRDHVVAGCKLHKDNDDDSLVLDWYYDVRALVADAGGDASAFESRAGSVDAVVHMCTDRQRYDEGADLVKP